MHRDPHAPPPAHFAVHLSPRDLALAARALSAYHAQLSMLSTRHFTPALRGDIDNSARLADYLSTMVSDLVAAPMTHNLPHPAHEHTTDEHTTRTTPHSPR